jgi:hypothetical protein
VTRETFSIYDLRFTRLSGLRAASADDEFLHGANFVASFELSGGRVNRKS